MVKQNNNTAARTFCVLFLYQVFLKENSQLEQSFASGEVNEDDFNESIDQFISTYTEPDQEHPDSNITMEQISVARKMLNVLKDHYGDISQVLAQSIRSSIDSLNPFDHAALLMGIAEIKYLSTPYEVVINELVIVSKTYGSISSSKFINGVLDGVSKS